MANQNRLHLFSFVVNYKINSLCILLKIFCRGFMHFRPLLHISHQVSKVGEKYVEKEVKKALIGIKQMKTTMEESEEIHKSLMLSLKKSSQKKEEVLQRARDVEQRLEKEEDTCQASLQSAWEDCKPCLEDACKTFYTTTCRRGFSIFTNFFSRMTPLFFTPHEGKDIRVNEDTEPKDTDITEIEDAFSHLMVDVTSTFDESVQLFKTLQQEFDQSFQKAFTSNMQPIRSSPNADSLESPFGGSGFFKDLGLTNLFQSLIDLSSILFDSFSAAIINTFDVVQNISTDTMKQHGGKNENLCRDIRRNASGCLQLQEKCQSCHPLFSQECPNLLEVRVEFTEASHLVDASNEEYQQVLQVVQRHTADIADQISRGGGRVAESPPNSGGGGQSEAGQSPEGTREARPRRALKVRTRILNCVLCDGKSVELGKDGGDRVTEPSAEMDLGKVFF
uniref:Clusterin n=1 Tax=Callorhinchus milii TaxID=7868 RepID=A0A4W3JKG6_CALMI